MTFETEVRLQSPVMSPERWFKRYGQSAAVHRRLVCFHHAGGGPSLFREWHKDFPPHTEVLAVATPGRETRFKEKPVTDMRVLVDMLVQVLPLDLPFAFFGHSLGAVIGFELARQLHERGQPVPERLFVSASPAPHLCRREISRARLGDTELLQLLERFGGTPMEVLEHPELRQIVLSTLRADFNLIDEYSVPDDCAMRLPITAYAGIDDSHISLDRIQAWERWATDGFSCHAFAGDHFYLLRDRRALTASMLTVWGR